MSNEITLYEYEYDYKDWVLGEESHHCFSEYRHSACSKSMTHET